MGLHKVLAGAMVLAVLWTPPLQAVAEESVREIEEIVVTSRRRTESVQDVPLSVTVFSEERIEQLNSIRQCKYCTLQAGNSRTNRSRT